VLNVERYEQLVLVVTTVEGALDSLSCTSGRLPRPHHSLILLHHDLHKCIWKFEQLLNLASPRSPRLIAIPKMREAAVPKFLTSHCAVCYSAITIHPYQWIKSHGAS
jgi:hypothetical protein